MKFKYAYSVFGRDVCEDDCEDVIEARDEHHAMEQVHEIALEDWLGYGGMHGLGMDLEDYLEEYPDSTEDEWHEFQLEYAESWLSYGVWPVEA